MYGWKSVVVWVLCNHIDRFERSMDGKQDETDPRILCIPLLYARPVLYFCDLFCFYFCRNENQALCDFLGKLESSTKSQGLSLQSFLMLPMQRITRLPLLMDVSLLTLSPLDGLNGPMTNTGKDNFSGG